MCTIEKLIAYEQGELNQQEVIDLFKSLLASKLIWKLQGNYQRQLKQLIESGLIN